VSDDKDGDASRLVQTENFGLSRMMAQNTQKQGYPIQ
jgi:hypothetical protein